MNAAPGTPPAHASLLPAAENRARLMYAPFRAVRGEILKDLTDAPGRLTESAIRSRCFEVLGLLDEYHRPPRTHADLAATETNVQEASEVRDLETYLARQRVKRTAKGEAAPASPRGVAELAAAHRQLITARIRELMAHPQVRGLLTAEITKERTRWKNARPLLRAMRFVQAAGDDVQREMYATYLGSKRTHKGVLVQTAARRIGVLSKVALEARAEEEKIRGAADRVQSGFLVAQELLTYKKQMEAKGFAMTPSRSSLLRRITEHVMSGRKVFLVGSTGTGKTELAFYVANDVTGDFELIPWHEGTTMKDVLGQMQIRRSMDGAVESNFKPGPLPRAMLGGKGAIHEEFTGGATRTMLGMKPYMNAKPGQPVRIPEMNGEALLLDEKFFEIFTGNPKDERTTEREELDPAILRMLKGIKVQYMPSSELMDIVLAQLMDSSGLLRLSRSEVQLIRRCAEAAEMMQRCHDNALSDDDAKILKDACGVEDLRLIKNFLDPGTFFALFARYDYERSRGKPFPQYLGEQLQEFLLDPKSEGAPEEQKLLLAVLKVKGVIEEASARGAVKISHTPERGEKPYLLPSQFIVLHGAEEELIDDDPLAVETPESADIAKLQSDILKMLRGVAGSGGSVAPRAIGGVPVVVRGANVPSRPPTQTELSEAASIMGPDHFYGPTSLQDPFNVVLGYGSMPPLPPTDLLRLHAAKGHTLRLRCDRIGSGTPMTMENMIESCTPLFMERGYGQLFNGSYPGQDFYSRMQPNVQWVFTTDAVLPDTKNRSFFDHTEQIVSYLQRLYAGTRLPPEFDAAMTEWDRNKLRIDRLLRGANPQQAAPELAKLKITQLRHTPVEALFDVVQTLCATGGRKRFLNDVFTWTSEYTSSDHFLLLGDSAAPSGCRVVSYTPAVPLSNAGATLSIGYPNPFA